MVSKFWETLHLEITPTYGWWFHEAQTAKWTSDDTRIRMFPWNVLKKLMMNVCRKLMRRNWLFNQNLSVVCPMITFLFAKGKWEDLTADEIHPQIWFGMLSLKVCWEIDTSRKSPWQRCRWCNSLEIHKVRSWNLRSWSEAETLSLIENGLIFSGREAARHDFSIARIVVAPWRTFEPLKDTLGEIWSNQSWWVISLFLTMGNKS